MEKISHAAPRDDEGTIDDVEQHHPSSSPLKKNLDPDLDKPPQVRQASLEQPATPATESKKPLTTTSDANKDKDDDGSKPRFWTKYPSARLNEPIPGEGLDLEAERRAHEAHHKHETVPCCGSVAPSPGSAVAAGMAGLRRESLSMQD